MDRYRIERYERKDAHHRHAHHQIRHVCRHERCRLEQGNVEDRLSRPLLLPKKEDSEKKADEDKERGKKDGAGGEAFTGEIEAEHEEEQRPAHKRDPGKVDMRAREKSWSP